MTSLGDPRILPHATADTLERVRRNVPAELRELRAWVCGDRSPRADGKSSKRPIDPRTGAAAKANDPSTWAEFEEAVAHALADDRCFGVGINLAGGEHVGLDLDGVLDPVTGEVNPAAMALIAALPHTYLERSPSGTGWRLFFRGRLPAGIGRSMLRDAFGPGTALEVYDGTTSGRYLTVTGDTVEPAPIAAVTDDDLAPIVELWERQRPRPSRNGSPHHHHGDRDHDLARAHWGLLEARLLDPDAGYHPWFRVLPALRELGDDGLALGIEWSRQSASFDEDEIRRKWPGLRGSSIGALFGQFDDAAPDWRQRFDEAHGRPDEPKAKAAAKPAERPTRTPPTSPADVLRRWQEHGPLLHEPTGWPSLDRMTRGGLVYGFVVTVVGAPDGSKTLFLTVLADRWAQAGMLVGVMAIDEDEDGLTTRLVQRRDGWTREDCERRVPANLAGMRRDLADVIPRLRFYDRTWSIEAAAADLAARAKELGVRAALFVDSLQTVRSDLEDERDGMREQVTNRMFALKAAATEHRLIVATTCEMTRAGYKGNEEDRDVNDMALGKESGSIEFQSKVLISTRAALAEDGGDRVKIKLVKNKLGATHRPADRGDCIMLRLDKAHQTLIEDESYVAPAQNDDPGAAVRDHRAAEDAARIAVLIAKKTGQTRNKLLQAAAGATPGGMGPARFNNALGALGEALHQLPGPNRSEFHHLDGSALPARVLDLVPVASRPAVVACRPPVMTGADGCDSPCSSAPESTAGEWCDRPPLKGAVITTTGAHAENHAAGDDEADSTGRVEQAEPAEPAPDLSAPLRARAGGDS